MLDIAGVGAHRCDRKAVVAPHHHRNATFAHLLISGAASVELPVQAQLGGNIGRNSRRFTFLRGVVNQSKSWPDEDLILDRFQHVERFFIREIAMVDAIDAVANGHLYAFR